MKFLEMAKLILALIPLIIELMKSIEAAIPGSGAGEQKLALVRGALEAVYKGSTDTVAKFDEIWPTLVLIIGNIVTVFNATGTFKK